MTLNGGVNANGNIFTGNTNGTGFVDLVSFDGNTGGSSPNGNLLPLGNKLFGMTASGGAGGGNEGTGGVIFSYEIPGLGINDLKTTNGTISVYPNPNDGKFIVAFNSQQSAKANIEVYNILGEQVLAASLDNTKTQNSIDMSVQSNGVYLYRVITENGILLGQGKLVVQK
jgi:hypothetical protein